MEYKNLSEDIERQTHPLWPDNWIKKEAAKRSVVKLSSLVSKPTISGLKREQKNLWKKPYSYPKSCALMPNGAITTTLTVSAAKWNGIVLNKF